MGKLLILPILLFTWSARAQQEYFTDQMKGVGLDYFKKQIYAGCTRPKDIQDGVAQYEMKRIIDFTKETVESNFSQAFLENPKVKKAFDKDLTELSHDQSCQREFNHCRVKLMSLALYYYQQFRPDSPDSELEGKFRKSSFEGVHSTNYGAQGVGTYKENLLKIKNDVTKKLFETIMRKDKNDYHICKEVRKGNVYNYGLNLEEAGLYLTDMDPEYHLANHLPKECIDEKKVIHQEFIKTNIDTDRFKVGLDEVEPVKKVISELIKNPDLIFTEISVTASVAKLPSYVTVNGKKTIDPESDNKNLSLAKERAGFLEKMLGQIKKSTSMLDKTTLKVEGKLAGPDFVRMDLNERFVTHLTPSFMDRVNATFETHKKLYQNEALLSSPDELTEEAKYGNLYQVKFKPFQGFRISITGFKKSEMKCLAPSTQKKKSGAVKQ